MKKLFGTLCILITFFYFTAGSKDKLQCSQSCDQSKCEEQSLTLCSTSVNVKDECGCCDVCQRFKDEICGGRNERFGKCAEGLKCVEGNSEAFLNDEIFSEDEEEEEEEDVIGVCQGSQNCIVSPWSAWSRCSEQCGIGTMKRRRVVIQVPKNGGNPCPVKHEKKGCFQYICKGNKVLAQILPAEYRRQPFGKNPFDKILPQKKVISKLQQIRERFRSHCVNFKLMSKHPYCDGTWAEKLKMSKPLCVECQPAIMDDQGFCKGEGIVGNFTSWVATDAKTCSGLWMRVGEKISNCKCIDQKFQNFIFV